MPVLKAAFLAALTLVLIGHSAIAADDPQVDQASAQGGSSPQPQGYFFDWFERVAQAQASQPHWMTPIATVTPRLEQEFRYDFFFQHQATGADIANYGGGKGLELIPTTTNEILINPPPYESRSGKHPRTGLADDPFLVVKQRLLSANEQDGNYIVTAFLGVQAPTGVSAFSNNAWVITPTLAAGKGWGNFDVQGTVGVPYPLEHEHTIGVPIATNVAFQYHLGEYLWPEVEVNDTYWTSGERTGKDQIFITPGIIAGRFQISGRVKAIVGLGYQIAVSPKLTTSPALTPMYDRGWILTTRITF